ncbi:hypothetical protein LDENG_00019300 [Lucifuga dentata]|nr:hypothetical protein LDENG_00019300 [Lucifuga dentata]
MGERRCSRMRNFNWETLPKHRVIGKHNIWTADRTDGEYELDTDHMEELFSHDLGKGKQQHNEQSRQSVRGLPASASGVEVISILSSKRSMNVGIFLKQFKRPVSHMIEEIKSGNGLSFGCGKLMEMCKMLPDEHEVKQLLSFKGDQSALPEADLFMLMLVRLSSYEERLNSLVLKEEFFPLVDEIRKSIFTLRTAGKELLEADNLRSIIRLVLKTGNYMNAGGYAGSAVGFRMASLLKLVDTKANKPGMNLMHYVVMQAQKVDEELLNFPEELQHIGAAAKINKGDIEAEYERAVKKVEDAKADMKKQEDLKAQMEDFLKEAEVCLAEVQADLQELTSVSNSVAEYFCEDPRKFKLEECCSIFKSFCEKFTRAFQDNKAREMAEVKRRQRDRLQIAAKRRSTATCSSRDKGMDGVALESILQNFLTSRISRRRQGRTSSNQGNPGGSSSNGSLSEITSQGNLPAENRGNFLRVTNMRRNEWNSAVELRVSSMQKELQPASKENKANANVPHEDMKMLQTEDSSRFTHPARRTDSSSSSGRTFSVAEDAAEDLEDNNEEEAQKLREASRKVLRYQNSRSSISSAEFCVDNQKSPGISSTSPRQQSFDEDKQRNIQESTNEDLVKILLKPDFSLKSDIICRRHALNFPNKVPANKEEEDNVWVQRLSKSANPAAGDAGTSEGPAGNVSQNFNVTQDKEKKHKPNVSVPNEEPGEQNHEGTSEATPTSAHNQSQNTPPRSPWIKAENYGFFSFLRRLGDMTKLPTSRDTAHRGSDSLV